MGPCCCGELSHGHAQRWWERRWARGAVKLPTENTAEPRRLGSFLQEHASAQQPWARSSLAAGRDRKGSDSWSTAQQRFFARLCLTLSGDDGAFIKESNLSRTFEEKTWG